MRHGEYEKCLHFIAEALKDSRIQKEKQLDTIPEDESGYLLADHLPDKVITDDESKNGICDKSVPTTNDLQNSHDSKKLESDISKEGVATNGLNHNPPCDES